MLKRFLVKKVFYPVLFFLTGLSAVLFLTGAGRFDKKITLIVTGELSDIFHPFGEDPDNMFLRDRLDGILTRLKKSYPDALLVDTGNYLCIQDFTVPLYDTPAIKHFLRYNYDVLNVGSNEVLLERIFHNAPFASDNEKPHLVSLMQYSSNGKNIGRPFVDISGDSQQKPVRFLGICPLSHTYSAPYLEKILQNPDFSLLSEHIKQQPLPGLKILLSDLPNSENTKIAESVSGIDLIVESGDMEQNPISKENGTFICRRVAPESVGLFRLKRNKQGRIGKVSFKSYSLKEKKGFLGLSRKKITRSVEKPLPVIGKMTEKQEFLKKLSVKYDSYEIRRFPIGKFSPDTASSQVFFYDLFHNKKQSARTLLVEHHLGTSRPYFLFFINFDLDNKVNKIDFVAPPCFLFWEMGITGFIERYYGKKWNEMSFDPDGCRGALNEYSALHKDILLAAQMVDAYFPLEQK